MRKLFILGALIATYFIANAQPKEVVTAYNFGIKPGATQYAKAIQAINTAIAHPQTMENDKAWFYRGIIYQNVYQSNKPEDKKLAEDPLLIAIESYQNAMKFKEKSDEWYNKSIENLNVARRQAIEEGKINFEDHNYQKALQYFETSLNIGLMPQINMNDPGIYYFIALSAKEAKELAKAKPNFILSLEKNFEPFSCVINISTIYLNEGDSINYVKTLKDGINKIPDNQKLLLLLTDYFYKSNQFDEALDYLDKAIEKEPNNKDFYFVKGTLYDNKGMVEEAYNVYNKVLSIDPKHIDTYYNIAVLFFNSGADFNNKANELPFDKEKEYAELREKAAQEFIKATKYFEKFLELEPTDIIVMKQLRQIYFQLRTRPEFNDKLNALDEKIKAVSE